jgi:Tfp pilus assembly protein PilP
MNLVTAMRRRIAEKMFPLLMALVLAAGPVWAQPKPGEPPAEAAAEPPVLTEAPSFEVLEVTTGSGAKRRKDNVKIEVLDLTPKSPAAAAAAARAEAEADPGLTPAQREARARAAALETALELWHSQTLGEYSFDIAGLRDPFMPIRDVRGQPAAAAGVPEGSPLLRQELNQFRLVAVTTRAGASGTGLASFEDETGASYILRPGDRIGRRQGRITEITDNAVTVEEPPPSPGVPARVTEFKLGHREETAGAAE